MEIGDRLEIARQDTLEEVKSLFAQSSSVEELMHINDLAVFGDKSYLRNNANKKLWDNFCSNCINVYGHDVAKTYVVNNISENAVDNIFNDDSDKLCKVLNLYNNAEFFTKNSNSIQILKQTNATVLSSKYPPRFRDGYNRFFKSLMYETTDIGTNIMNLYDISYDLTNYKTFNDLCNIFANENDLKALSENVNAVTAIIPFVYSLDIDRLMRSSIIDNYVMIEATLKTHQNLIEAFKSCVGVVNTSGDSVQGVRTLCSTHCIVFTANSSGGRDAWFSNFLSSPTSFNTATSNTVNRLAFNFKTEAKDGGNSYYSYSTTFLPL